MLTITFRNDGTGGDRWGNYQVRAMVNGKLVEETHITGHDRSQDWRKLVGRLVLYHCQSDLEQELNSLFQEYGPTCTDAVDAVRMLQELLKAQQTEIQRYERWIDDLQAGGYVNCVYCGHRYGLEDEVPTSMAQALKDHIEQCPQHPMSKLKADLEEQRARNELFSQCMHRGLVLWREAHPQEPCRWPDGAENILWLLERLDEAQRRAREEYRVFQCPKCFTEFEDPDPENEFPEGVICPSCTGDLKGVIHPRYVKRIITQGNWDRACLDRTMDQELIEDLREDTERQHGQLAEIAEIVGVDMCEMASDDEIAQAVREQVAQRAEAESPKPKLAIYSYAGKLGPWARGGCEGKRYLALGMQGQEEYVQIASAEKSGEMWRYVRVVTVDGTTHEKWCGTNVYEKIQ